LSASRIDLVEQVKTFVLHTGSLPSKFVLLKELSIKHYLT